MTRGSSASISTEPAFPTAECQESVFQVRRSPARISRPSRFSGGASGHAQRGSNAHDGWVAKLKSRISVAGRLGDAEVVRSWRHRPGSGRRRTSRCRSSRRGTGGTARRHSRLIQNTDSRLLAARERQPDRADPAERQRVGAAVRQLQRRARLDPAAGAGSTATMEAQRRIVVEVARAEVGPARRPAPATAGARGTATRGRRANARARRPGRSPPSPGPRRTASRPVAASRRA